MRGFLHIIEIIIISLVMFIIVFQFSTIPTIPFNFEAEKLSLQGEDMLFSLDHQGINWLDKQEVTDAFALFLDESNIVYGIRVENAIKTPFIVGCICDDQEMDWAEQVLTSFRLNNQFVNVTVLQQIDPPTQQGCQNFDGASLPLIYDVIIMRDYNLTGDLGCQQYDYTPELKNFLSAGKGFVQIRDLDESTVTGLSPLDPGPESTHQKQFKYYFGLRYNPLIGRDPNAVLEHAADENSSFFNTKKYFHFVPFHFEPFAQDDGLFQGTGTWAVSEGEYRAQPTGFDFEEALFVGGLSPGLETDYTVSVDFAISGDVEGYWLLSYTDDDTFVAAGFDDNSLEIFKLDDVGMDVERSSLTYDVDPLAPHTMKVSRAGDTVILTMFNGTGYEQLSRSFGTGIPAGDPGLAARGDGEFFTVDNARFGIPESFRLPQLLAVDERIERDSEAIPEAVVVQEEDGGLPAVIAQTDFSVPSNLDDLANSGNTFLPGRVVWISEGIDDDLAFQQLVNSMVIWAGGDKYRMLTTSVVNPAVVNFLTTTGPDMFQPIEIIVNLGFIF